MKTDKQSLHKQLGKDQRGMSLMEVIVTLLIMTLIAVSVSVMISIVSRCYTIESAENIMSKEAQIAQNQIESVLCEAVSYDFMTETVSGISVSELLIEAYEQEGSSECKYYYCFIWNPDKKILTLNKVKASDLAITPEEWKTNVATAQIGTDEPSLCASYLTKFVVTPNQKTAGDKVLIRLELEFELQGKIFAVSGSVTARNR